MFIRIGYDIEFSLPQPTAMTLMLYAHPSRTGDLLQPDEIRTDPQVEVRDFLDTFGNRCARIAAPAGPLRLWTDTIIRDSGLPDPTNWDARQQPVEDLPSDVLQYLLASRYCEVDLLSELAWRMFGDVPPGWARVQAICNWVHENVRFGYSYARSTKTAVDVLKERSGVCRDFQHLAVTFCRAMNIPARYVTGYLGDIGVPAQEAPMDFSAWFEAYLDGRWYAFDARHNTPRIARILMAAGRDATDVALTTSFGAAQLKKFSVITDEIPASRLFNSSAVEELASVA